MDMAFVVRPEEGSDPFGIFSGKRGFLRHQKVDGLRVFLSLRVYWVMSAGGKESEKQRWFKHWSKIFFVFWNHFVELKIGERFF